MAQKGLDHYRSRLRDQWNIHGLTGVIPSMNLAVTSIVTSIVTCIVTSIPPLLLALHKSQFHLTLNNNPRTTGMVWTDSCGAQLIMAFT